MQGTKPKDVPSFVIVGRMVSGKSRYAKTLKEALEREFHVPVHMALTSSFIIAKLAREYFNAQDEADGKPSRTLMQEIGGRLREMKPTVWVDYVIRDIRENDKIPFISEGMRASYEVDSFRQTFPFPQVVVIKIEADENQRREIYRTLYGAYPTDEQLHHPTEMSIDEIRPDLVLFNNYNENELNSQVAELVSAVRSGAVEELLRQKKS